ncbi:MAG: hypothetical protein K0S20_72 [Patescibacteria group bacterium]|jgi:hypothetical protein|nr:hypothetical protein [Patescibacteria group bacterium]
MQSNLIVVSGCSPFTANQVKGFLESELQRPFLVQVIMPSDIIGMIVANEDNHKVFRGIALSKAIWDENPQIKKTCDAYRTPYQVNHQTTPESWRTNAYSLVVQRIEKVPLLAKEEGAPTLTLVAAA